MLNITFDYKKKVVVNCIVHTSSDPDVKQDLKVTPPLSTIKTGRRRL
jgi:hypothetical protein